MEFVMAEKRKRSPSFPYIGMREGEQLLRAFYSSHGKIYVPIELAYKSLNLNPKSSTTKRTMSSLIGYGVIEDEGVKENKRVRITSLGTLLIKETRESNLLSLRRKIVLNDTMMETAFKKFGITLPSDKTMMSALQVDLGFMDRAATRFINVIHEDYAYADLCNYNPFASESQIDDTSSKQNDDDGLNQTNNNAEIKPPNLLDDELKDYRIPLNGVKRFAFLHVPSGLSSKDAEFIKKHVDLLMMQLIDDNNA